MAEPLDPNDVPIKLAATVMLVRDTSSDTGVGIEVFMLRRTTSAVVAGGMYVFPGGKLDPSDGEGDDAFLVAAIRECYEEAGVLLAEEQGGELVADGHPALAHREAVHDGSTGIHALCAAHHLHLAVDRMAWVARWITPKGETARRFDTRFFLAVAPAGQSSVHDDSETIASEWVRPADALARQRAGEMVMLPPTVVNLEFLAGFTRADDALGAGRTIGVPPTILPKIRYAGSGAMAGISMPGDADYDALD
jgi:8-oxo-dGTP pyrophosphatase MutT (NUDIX family)